MYVRARSTRPFGLPGVGGEDHEDAAGRSEDRGPNDERRVADAPVGAGELEVVEAARDVRDLERDRVRRALPPRPVEMDRRQADVDAGELVVRVRDHLLGPRMEHA
jgi:hypothetical protein